MAWDEETIQKVWEKGKIVPDQKADQWRKDECGAWIGRQNYGKRDSSYGWEIDHISPGGPDILSNLRPLQWENNAEKSEGRFKMQCDRIGNQECEESLGPSDHPQERPVPAEGVKDKEQDML